MNAVGQPISRVDGRLKTIGGARYTADIPLGGMVPDAHAELQNLVGDFLHIVCAYHAFRDCSIGRDVSCTATLASSLWPEIVASEASRNTARSFMMGREL